MIRLKKSNNIFYSKKVILDYFSNDLPDSSQGLDKVNWLELKISGEDNEEVFNVFLERFIQLLKTDFFIDFISYESKAELKGRIRSYAKHFYTLRKKHLVNENSLIEKEISTTEKHSIFSGIIRVNEVEDEIIFGELLGHYSRIIHGELKHPSKENADRLEELLAKIDLDLLKVDKLVNISHLNLISRFVDSNSMIFSYFYDGGDDLVFTLYSGNGVSNKLEKILIDSLPKSRPLETVAASSREVDELITSYFNDWRREVKKK